MLKENQKHARLKQLLKERSYLEGDFILASGAHSRFFFDAKMTLLDAEGINLTADLLLDKLEGDRVDAVGGLVVGACAMATAMSLKSWERGKNLRAFYVRKDRKDHGTRKQVEGPELKPGDRVVLVDDVVTSGGSLLEAARCVHDIGCEIARVLTIVDRQQGGAEKILAETGVPLEALFKREELESRSSI